MERDADVITTSAASATMVRSCRETDALRICEIYNYFVADTVVTFEESAVSEGDMLERIRKVTSALPWLVCEDRGTVAGYAYAAPWHTRSAYRFSVESSIYLDRECRGRGIGTRLYSALLEELRARGVHCVIGGIALPNAASVALHEKLGFRKAGHVREVGWKLGRWVDVGYWQLLLGPASA